MIRGTLAEDIPAMFVIRTAVVENAMTDEELDQLTSHVGFQGRRRRGVLTL